MPKTKNFISSLDSAPLHPQTPPSRIPFSMATLLPPPTKRQKVETTEKARQQQEIQGIPDNLGSVRVQFFDQATGSATGPAVSVPVADANVKNLETLLNTLQGNVGMLSSWANRWTNDFNRRMTNEYPTDLPTNPTIRRTILSIYWRTYTIRC